MSEQLPAQWALDKAARLSGWDNWDKASGISTIFTKGVIIAHARTLEKYEQPPEDPDKLAVREILAAAYHSAGAHILADGVLAGDFDESVTLQSSLAAYKREKAK